MKDKITMIELFSGIGAQERALRQIGIPYEVIATCDCDKDAVLSYASMRSDFEDEFGAYDFPSADEMIKELQSKNVGYDFMKGKHTITSRTSVDKVKQYYLADKLSRNLGDIGKVEKLPYADIVTYSFPCTDLSVAGKGEGMVIKCDKCGHSWPIDFSVSESDVVCSNCGNTNIKSTRSGLLGEVQRLLSVSKEENTLPKYLLLENVKNLVGKKFKPQFDAWIKWLDSIGYNTYYKVLNAKHYGIPQNRERIFAVSIRKDIDDGTFKFPNEIPLTTRLRDILEMNVDEKYYIDNDRTKAILNSDEFREKIRNINNTSAKITSMYGEQLTPGQINIIGNYMNSCHEASRIIDPSGIAPTVKENHGTVTAIVEPNIIKVWQLDSSFDQSGRVYSTDGIAPTVMSNSHGKTSGGYTSPKILVSEEPFIVASRGRNPDNPSDRTTGVPTEQRLEPNLNGTTNTITTVQKDNYVCEPIVCEERRDEGIRFFKDDCCGTLRTIDACGDKRVLEPEPHLEFVGGLGDKDWAKDGKKLSRNYPQGSRVYSSDGIASALTAQGVGGAGGYSGLYTVEEVDTIKVRNQATEFAGYTDVAGTLMARDYKGFGNQEMTAVMEKFCEPEIIKEDIKFPVTIRKYEVDTERLKTILREHKCYTNKEIAEKLNVPLTKVEHWFRQDECFAIPDANIWFDLKNLLNITTDEFDESIMTFEIKDGVYDKSNRCYHIDGIAPTLTVASGNEKIFESQWRIRKLTPKECWRLMGFTDEDCDNAAKNVSASALYKQAGNSICTCCLVAIFNALFLKDYSILYEIKLVDYNSTKLMEDK